MESNMKTQQIRIQPALLLFRFAFCRDSQAENAVCLTLIAPERVRTPSSTMGCLPDDT